MQNLFFIVRKTLPALLLALPFLACTQSKQVDPMTDRFEQLLSRMQEQMRRGMPFDTTFSNGQLQFSPDSSSYFYFHVDTSFGDFGGSDFFQFPPFGAPGRSGFPDMDSLFEQFFNRMSPLTAPHGYQDSPADDGDAEHAEDDLLPEERLRIQEEQKKQGADPAPQPVKPEKSKVKTIRI